jgi:hypothetical protein
MNLLRLKPSKLLDEPLLVDRSYLVKDHPPILAFEPDRLTETTNYGIASLRSR